MTNSSTIITIVFYNAKKEIVLITSLNNESPSTA